MANVFEKFGGIRPMAAKLGFVPPSTVMSWERKGRIPAWRHAEILSAAQRLNIPLTVAELTRIPPASEQRSAA